MAVRMRFERGVHALHPDLVRRTVGRSRKAAVSYRLSVEIPDYDDREIELLFSRTTPQPVLRGVYADGPDHSPHRWPSRRHRGHRRLCMWHPDDPPEQQWNARFGLLSLITVSRIHLYKEAHWRETGDWLGPEVPHLETAGKGS